MDAKPVAADGHRRVRLHTGADLALTVERSAEAAAWLAEALPASSSRLRAFRDALETPSFDLWPTRMVVTGTERSSGTSMRILFRGRQRALDFCARHILGTADYDRAAAPAHAADWDVTVVDYPFADALGAGPTLRVPSWVRQSCDVGVAWSETFARMPSSLRKRLAQQLAPGRYAVELDASTKAKVDFYRRLYRPFVERRFGAAAILTGERAFLRRARDGVLLGLWLGADCVGATLLERHGSTLRIAKSGMSVEHSVRYRSDLLDYYCFVAAQLLGCTTLDFGASRPHVEDGVFANKTKWRPKLESAGSFKSALRISASRPSPAALGFLRRNGFLERRGEAFVVRRLASPELDTATARAELDEIAVRAGLAAVELAPLDVFVGRA